MLRYKNSLLERILLEKGTCLNSWTIHLFHLSLTPLIGIDVQAELRAKTGSPHLGPTHLQQSIAQPPTVQRAIMNRHHQARRSNSSIAPKLEPGVAFHSNQSPQSRPTPPSHVSSPTTSSPGFNHNQGVLTPPSSESQMQHQQQRLQAAKTHAQHALSGTTGLLVNTGMGMSLGAKGQGNAGSNNTASAPVAAAYYPSFQNHIEQLGKLTRPLLSFSFYRAMFVLD